jgi:hypothetical protein
MSKTKPKRGRAKLGDRERELDEETRREIERRAHERYRARGGVHGSDLNDWLAAEEEVRAERAAAQAAPVGDKGARSDRVHRRRRPRE